MLIPKYSTCIVHGDTILNIKVYFRSDYETTFLIKLSYDDDDDSDNIFDFGMEMYFPSWQDRLSDMISELVCSECRRAIIRQWEETMYYHFDSLIRRLRLPDFQEYLFAVTFDVEFVQASKEAMERLNMTSFAAGPNNNLLERVKYDDGDHKCDICFENFKESDEHLTRMPCSHTFHYSCLTMWMPKHENCPTCRFVLNWNTMDDLPLY